LADLTLYEAFDALSLKLAELVTDPVTTIIGENFQRSNDAPPDLPYLEPQFISTPRRNTQTEQEVPYEAGIFQVSINFPRGSGLGTWIKIAGQIKEHFPTATVLRRNGVEVKVSGAVRIPAPLYDGDKAAIPVQIPFTAT
jgi:hypothetical protein